MLFESFTLNVIVIVVLIIALIFDYITKFFSYWYVRHIPNNTCVPFFGSDYHRVFGIRSNTEQVNTLYAQYPNDKFVGSVKSRIPDLVVRDPDAVKTLLSTDFAYFQNRGLSLDKSRDVCIRNNLFYSEGEKWTLLRESFESILNNMTQDFEDSLHGCLSGTNGDTNVQQLLSNVLDAVFKDILLFQNSKTDVISRMYKNVANQSASNKIKTYLKNVFPSLYVLFGLATVSGEPSYETKKELEKSQLLKLIRDANVVQMSLKDKMHKKQPNDLDFAFDILASFITEGYLPCLNSLTALLYNLAANPQSQKMARSSEEYLTAAIKETLRLHPPYSVITRQCGKMYHYPDSNLVLDKKITINVPIESIHRDEKYYKEADAFKPERFLSEDNMQHGFAFLPFGAGHRKCIGEQLSMQILQKVSNSILKKFNLSTYEETAKELVMADHSFGRVITNDFWLRITPIK